MSLFRRTPPPGRSDDRPLEPITGRPATPVFLAALAVPALVVLFALSEALEWWLLPVEAAATPGAIRTLHLLRGMAAALVFAFLGAWAVGRNWERALTRIRAAEARARAAERETLERERLAALGRIAAGVAHEVGNPLASISAIVQILRKKGPDARMGDRLRIIETEIERITGIVRKLLDFARPFPAEATSVEVGRVIDRVVEMVRLDDRSRGIEVAVAAPPSPDLRARIDPGAFEQILLNLVWNAIEAIRAGGRGGRIEIAVRRDPDGRARIDVADDGPGVPEGSRRRIFEPFYTTKEMGTGLGLSVVHGLVEEAGGRIEVDRSSLGGALFRVLLPAPSADDRAA